MSAKKASSSSRSSGGADAAAAMEAAAGKIDAVTFVAEGDAPTAEALRKAQRLVAKHGAYGEQLVFTANWADNGSVRPPTGFAFAAREGAPVVAELFDPEKLCYGATAVALPLGSAADRRRCSSSVLAAAGVPLPAPAEAAGAHAGLYVSTQRGAHGYEETAWAVAQHTDAAASRALYAKLEDATAANDTEQRRVYTLKSVFVDAGQMAEMAAAASAARARSIAAVAATVGVRLDARPALAGGRSDFFAGNQQRLHAVETLTNLVADLPTDVAVAASGAPLLVYYAGTTPTHVANAQVGAPLLMPEAPALGPLILAPPAAGRWAPCAAALNAFPFGTGRRRVAAAAAAGDQQLVVGAVAAASASGARRLARGVYRARDAAFKQAELALGREIDATETWLQPRAVVTP